MRISTRMWLLGAGVPVLGVLIALALAGWVFEAWLAKAVDRALLTQAAVEAVSLFDGPGGTAHLHLESSTLELNVRGIVPTAELYGPDGRLVLTYPDSGAAIGPPPAPVPLNEPRFETTPGPDGGRLRQLTLSTRSPEGELYLLRLSASLSQKDQAIRAFSTIALGLAVLLGGLLFALQAWQARWVSRRLGQLRALIARLREGGILHAPASPPQVDEIAEVEDTLREASSRLHEARQSQEELIARAAHELRTPLALMRTHLDLALWKQRDAEALREALGETRREVERLSALAGSLLDLASFGRGRWEVRQGDLREVVDDAAAAARAEAEGRGVWILVEGPEPAPCSFHAPSVRQAMDNLLANALRYAPTGTEISVRLAREAHAWRISVRDRGPGIPLEHREAVFKPFHRVEPAGPGTGLGLAVVHEVAQRHGGRVFVTNEAPGAEVVLALPTEGPKSEIPRVA
ncbi:MAG: HAMP domain-containing histidine kinase [Myxococcaceae bacterium]|nr:HAMP domain-containing histidine kinase [Myxococcaceae bacterium]